MTMKKFIKTLKAVAVCGLLALVASESQAGLYSLNATNTINNTVTNYTSWPTNQISTNGNPQSTGKPVYIGDVKEALFQFQGYLSNSTAVSMQVILVTANTTQGRGSNPTVGTNGIPNDFAYTAQTSFNIAIPALTNWFNWQTNISFVGASATGILAVPNAEWLGIYTITNNFAANQYITTALITNGAGTVISPAGQIMWGIEKKYTPTYLATPQ